MLTPLEVLKKYWGYNQFRPPQESIIQHILNDENVCAFLPTGGGKSICFQVPAMCKKGICIVISPLIALMEDQVINLTQRGISAVFLKAGMHFKEVNRILDNCIYGNTKFLYLSPERLQQELVQERIKQMNVNLFAIDEAHCISQWGHDFRPSYRKLSILNDLKPNTTTIAVTATATTKVQQDIVEQLQLKKPIILKQSLKRDNIGIHVKFCNDKYDALLEKLKHAKASSIVYVRSRKATKELSIFLNQNQINAAAYSGGLIDKERKDVLQQWLNEKTQVVVATNAFGMGIDKANVRQVIHFHLPESLESYFQEIGRCGRDRMPSEATILYNKSDIKRLKEQFVDVIPQLNEVIEIYIKLTSYFSIAYGEGENETFELDLYKFCNTYGLNSHLVYNTLELLDRLSILVFHKSSYQQAALQFICNQKDIFEYLNSHPEHDDICNCLLRTYGGVFDNLTPIDINLLAHLTKSSKKQIVKSIEELKKADIINAYIFLHELSITFLVPKENKRTIYRFANEIKAYKTLKYNKAKAVVDFIRNSNQCRSNQLLNYFGEQNNTSCMTCSVCLNLETNTNIYTDYKKVSTFILNKLALHECDARSLIEHNAFSKFEIIETLKKLLDQKKINISDKNTYKLNKL